MTIRCIVGLGNPGAQYASTRHNVGAWWIDAFAEQQHSPLRLDKKFRAFVGECIVDNKKCFLLKPTTYMNESGVSVSLFAQFYKIKSDEIVVVHDEMDFPAGDVRLKVGGGHGGHNGLRDIISRLHSQDFYRIRLGIGRPVHRDQVTDYVLGNPSRSDRDRIFQAVDESIAVVPVLLSDKIQQAFHQLHSD